uniref:Gelsolin-like domain-containing protein n=1 Tax=Oryza punctata TaxID=4537 RepID=A0A0E0KYL7_ORYPU
MKGVDDAFLGVGDKPGLDIWCIMGSNLVAIEKTMHGKFYTGNTYVILSTVELKSGVRQHNVHYWVGEEAKEEDCLAASDKAIELDVVLGSNTVQYRETQGEESDKFLSYFKPCIIPIQGSLSSHMRISGDKSKDTTMFRCEGEHVARVTEVPFSRSSLDHKAVFVVDTESKIFLFSGCNSSMQTRAKALDVVKHLKENRHCGRCEIATIEDGKLVGDSDAGDFWNLFGGYAPIPRDVQDTVMTGLMTTSSKKLFWINKRNLVPVETNPLEREMLNSDRNYILDCGTDVFLWMGMTTLVSERRTSVTALEDYVRCEGRQSNAHSVILTEGHETVEFKMHFQHWPKNVVPKLYEAGREKVAAIFKHQGYDVTEIPEDKPRNVISCNGSLKVWLVDNGSVTLLCTEEQEQLYNGDCYIIRYSYIEDGKDYHLFFAWSGLNSVNEDRVAAGSLMSGMADSVKGHTVVAQVFEGREPEMLFLVFKSLIIFKGGRSMAYKNFVSQRSDTNGWYQKNGVALFRVQGLKHDCIRAIQVDLAEDQNTQKKSKSRIGLQIHICILVISNKAKEVFSFSQDDLVTEEILILDCVEELYIWVGLHSGVLSKEQALDIGKMFLQAGIHQDGRRSIETTMYIVTEGDEPRFFTSFFNWDYSKQTMLGNSFERKLAILKGISQKLETPERSLRKSSSSSLPRRSRGLSSSEPTTPEQRAAARTLASASTGKLARERSPAASTAALSPSLSMPSSLRSRSSGSSSPASWNSTPSTVARRLFPPSLHASAEAVATGTPRRR